MKLSYENFQKSKLFVYENARELEKTLCRYYFEEGSKESVLEALAVYQNDDGGFGHSIEPDFRLEGSSPMGTAVALSIIKDLDVEAQHPVIKKAIYYLMESFDSEMKKWHAVPPEVNDVPHAIWWEYNPEKERSGVETTWANPNAEIVGYLHQYAENVPNEFLQYTTGLAIEKLYEIPEKLDMHDFFCYQILFEALPESSKGIVRDKLSKSVALTVASNPEEWGQYAAKPLQLVTSPNSYFYPFLKSEVALNLDYEINKLNPDGSWRPNWSWLGEYEDVWKQAEQEWSGHLTVKNLKTLYDFGRIEER